MSLPPDWPAAVRPPDTEDWELSAVAWLLDLLPGEWRAHDVLRRHPVLLARLASRQLEGTLEATRDAWRTLRRDVRGQLPPDVVEAAMTAYETEGARFAARVREVAAVTQALAGRRWIPGAGRWAEN
ncbi:MAG TPA: hypothetical protein VF109_03640 [Mycobacteriales bacterium]